MIVVDSGVVVDLLIGRLRPDDLGSGSVGAPHLIDTELLSALRGLWLGDHLAPVVVDLMVAAVGELAIDRFPAEPLRDRVWELRHNLTAYDATYVALAEALDTTLLTTDAKLARAPGLRCPVTVL